MYAELVMLQSQLQGPAMAFNNMIGQMNSQRVGLPMSTYNPYAASTMQQQQQQYLMMQAQNRLMGLTRPQAHTTNNATNASSNQVIELD